MANWRGSDVKTSCVVGFPLGANKTSVKAFEAAEAVKDGADEVDMVLNIGALREGNLDLAYEDIRAVVEAAAPAKVKVIIETCYLTDDQKVAACELSCRAGAAFVKTSTGMGTGGATVRDVQLMKQAVRGRAKVKASGNIDNRKTAYELLRARSGPPGRKPRPADRGGRYLHPIGSIHKPAAQVQLSKDVFTGMQGVSPLHPLL